MAHFQQYRSTPYAQPMPAELLGQPPVIPDDPAPYIGYKPAFGGPPQYMAGQPPVIPINPTPYIGYKPTFGGPPQYMSFQYPHGTVLLSPAALPAMSYNTPHPVVAQLLVPNSNPHGSPGNTPMWPRERTLDTPQLLVHLPPVILCPSPAMAPLPPVWESGTFPAEPIGSDVPIRLHPRLALNPLGHTDPVLQWDVVQPPSLARAVGGRRILLPMPLDEPAFDPDVQKIYITADYPYIRAFMEGWGPIVIDKTASGGKITVREVLEAIYDYFRTPIDDKQRKALERVAPTNKLHLKRAYNHRVAASYAGLPSINAQEKCVRSDVLGMFRKFQGLRLQVFQDRTWKLYLGFLPDPVPDITL